MDDFSRLLTSPTSVKSSPCEQYKDCYNCSLSLGNMCAWGGGAEGGGGDYYGDCSGTDANKDGQMVDSEKLGVTDMY